MPVIDIGEPAPPAPPPLYGEETVDPAADAPPPPVPSPLGFPAPPGFPCEGDVGGVFPVPLEGEALFPLPPPEPPEDPVIVAPPPPPPPVAVIPLGELGGPKYELVPFKPEASFGEFAAPFPPPPTVTV
jgi:hypothetical protein